MTKLFNEALEAQKAAQFGTAEKLYRRIIAKDPRNFDALHMLGIVCAENAKMSDAERFFRAALSVDARYPPCYHNFGLFYVRQKRYQQAIQQFDKALALAPNYAPVHSDRGCALMELGRLDESLISHNAAVKLAPNVAIAFHNRGNTFLRRGDHTSALHDFEAALRLQPAYADAYCGRGVVLLALKRHDEALAQYERALAIQPNLAEAWLGCGAVLSVRGRHAEAAAAHDRALTLKPDLAEAWIGRGNSFFQLGRYEEALAAYDRAIALEHDLAGAWNGRANVLLELMRHDEALTAYDRALAIKPNLAEAWNGRGICFFDLKRHADAATAFDRALALNPDLAEAWNGRANNLAEINRHEDAFVAYDRALALKPTMPGLLGARLHAKMWICDWSDLCRETDDLLSSVRSGNPSTVPFCFVATPSSPRDQLDCARQWIESRSLAVKNPLWRGEQYGHDRIRVAYLSADFHDHATSYLMAGLFECHDRSRFEVTAISYGPDSNSDMRRRLMATFEHFVDVRAGKTDNEIANIVRSMEIDILVDLKGFTRNSRTGIVARRPAPIQVNYLGFPGTMGVDYIDYIVADRIVIPDEHKAFYSEKVVWLPNCYQANDAKRAISDRTPTRAELGLPQTAFVFSCFNNNFKITPRMFDCWMRILSRVEGSVLWLLEDNARAASNLKREAAARGIDPSRLVFAQRMPAVEHLARQRAADLFLDTLPYSAHTTASDALWAGLPVLTCLGEAFSGRVAASLLHAIDLPELVTATLDVYEKVAVEIAACPDRLALLKQRLAGGRATAPLFNTRLFTKHMEDAYGAMHERYKAGLPPDHLPL